MDADEGREVPRSGSPAARDTRHRRSPHVPADDFDVVPHRRFVQPAPPVIALKCTNARTVEAALDAELRQVRPNEPTGAVMRTGDGMVAAAWQVARAGEVLACPVLRGQANTLTWSMQACQTSRMCAYATRSRDTCCRPVQTLRPPSSKRVRPPGRAQPVRDWRAR
jgi:hypothetical protein